MKRLHVLMISLHADPASPPGALGGGGTHSYVRELLTGLSLRGHRCTLITRRTGPELPKRQVVSRTTTIFRVPIGPLAPMDKKLLHDFHQDSLAQTSLVVDQLRYQPQLIHSIYWNSGRLAMDLSRNLKLPFFHTVISNGARRLLEHAEEKTLVRIAVEKEIFSSAFRIFCICTEERDDLISLYGADPKKLLIVGRPVAQTFARPAHDELGQPRLINQPYLLGAEAREWD